MEIYSKENFSLFLFFILYFYSFFLYFVLILANHLFISGWTHTFKLYFVLQSILCCSFCCSICFSLSSFGNWFHAFLPNIGSLYSYLYLLKQCFRCASQILIRWFFIIVVLIISLTSLEVFLTKRTSFTFDYLGDFPDNYSLLICSLIPL